MKTIPDIKEFPAYKLLILVIIPWAVLAIIFGFTDLEISKAVVDTKSSLGKFGSHYGEIPGYTLIVVAITVLVGSCIEEIKKQKVISFIVIISELAIFISNLISKNYDLAFLTLSIISTLVIISILTYEKDWKEYVRIAIIIILLATIITSFVEITKVLCGRVRFKDLSSNYSNYTPWFLPPGPDPKNKSFPSGHAALGWILLPLIILVKDRKWNDQLRIIITALVIGWGFFVAISRVISGAHYASDVLFSTGVAAIITIMLYKWLYLDNHKVKQNKKEDQFFKQQTNP